MSDILPQITLAAVQASSVHLDRTATVAKACALIAEAGAKGADLIAFPEGFIPAHPCWFTVRPATDKISLGLSRQLFQNAVVIPSADTDALAQACSDARAVFGGKADVDGEGGDGHGGMKAKGRGWMLGF